MLLPSGNLPSQGVGDVSLISFLLNGLPCNISLVSMCDSACVTQVLNGYVPLLSSWSSVWSYGQLVELCKFLSCSLHCRICFHHWHQGLCRLYHHHQFFLAFSVRSGPKMWHRLCFICNLGIGNVPLALTLRRVWWCGTKWTSQWNVTVDWTKSIIFVPLVQQVAYYWRYIA